MSIILVLSLLLIVAAFLLAMFAIPSCSLSDSEKKLESENVMDSPTPPTDPKIDILDISWSASSAQLLSVRTTILSSLAAQSGLPSMQKALFLRVGVLIIVVPIRKNWELLTSRTSKVPLLLMFRATLIALLVSLKYMNTLSLENLKSSPSTLPSALFYRTQRKYKRYSIQALAKSLYTDEKAMNILKSLSPRLFVIDFTPRLWDLTSSLLMSLQDSIVSILMSPKSLTKILERCSEEEGMQLMTDLRNISVTSTPT